MNRRKETVFFGYYGGKKYFAREIIKYIRFPDRRNDWAYIEPFVGSGSVFFAFPEPPAHAIFADKYQRLATLWRVITYRSAEFLEFYDSLWLDESLLEQFWESEDELEQAAAFLMMIVSSYNAIVRFNPRFSRTLNDCTHLPPKHDLETVAQILQAANAQVFNCDFRELFALVARNNYMQKVIYCDPPYVQNSSGNYGEDFGEEDHRELAEILHALDESSTWFLSYDCDPLVEELYATDHRVTLTVPYQGQIRSSRRKAEWSYREEYLISNKPLTSQSLIIDF